MEDGPPVEVEREVKLLTFPVKVGQDCRFRYLNVSVAGSPLRKMDGKRARLLKLLFGRMAVAARKRHGGNAVRRRQHPDPSPVRLEGRRFYHFHVHLLNVIATMPSSFLLDTFDFEIDLDLIADD